MGFENQAGMPCVSKHELLIFTAENASEKGTDERPNSFHIIKVIIIMRRALKLFDGVPVQSLEIEVGWVDGLKKLSAKCR